MLDPKGPGFAPSRPRGAKGAGLRYERALGKALPKETHRGLWIKFEDRNGLGWAQPDFLLGFDGKIAILEAKYTWVPEGHSQIELLYRPLVERIWQTPIVGVVVCKVLTSAAGGAREIFSSLGEALAQGREEKSGTLHWIGTGPLFKKSSAKPFPPEALHV